MSDENITTVSREWATRPEDQRFSSMEALKASVSNRRTESWTVTPDVRSLKVIPGETTPLISVFDPTQGEDRILQPTHFAFGQMAGYARAPASYLRTLPAELASINLQWGLEHSPLRDDALMLAQSNGSNVMRAMTSIGYGRIWDIQVVEAVEKANHDGRWQIPSASYTTKNPRRATTLYASDRDVFIFLVDPKNPIDIPGEEHPMFRGFYCWNSEVGAATFGLCTFLYRYVCDNRIIWGATDVKELRIRHTSGAPDRFAYEGEKYLARYAEESTNQIVQGIAAAKTKGIPNGKDESVSQWLQSRGFTKAQAQGAVDSAVAEEGRARSIWDVVNGITAYARSITHTDERVSLEAKAGKLMELAV
jgi:hypothetical protein